MADNWWESSSSRNRFESSGGSASSSTMALGGSFGWPTTEILADLKTPSSLISSSSSSCTAHLLLDSPSSSSPLPPSLLQINNLFQDSHHHHHHNNKLHLLHSAPAAAAATDPSLHVMGLGLDLSPSQAPLDWNQPNLFRGGDQKGEGSFRNMLQEDHLSSNTSSFTNQETPQMASSMQQHNWRSPKNMYSSSPSEDSSVNDFKQQIGNRGFQLEQPAVQYSDNNSIITTCQGLPISNSNFQMDDSYGSPSTILQGLFSPSSDNNNQQQHQQQQQQQTGFDHRSSIYNSSYQSNYIGMSELSPSSTSTNWSTKYSPQDQLIPGNLSPPKQATNTINSNYSPLHFTNNARFWNADVNDVRSSFFPSLQMQLPSSTFADKPKITSESVKKSSSEPSTKRPRSETQSPLPAFKVRKEKMGDRITALQQLVSPFGKTDTASVLSEAIEYIRFLHEQVSVLSTPYMKNGAPTIQQQQQQASDKSLEGGKQDLRSRGLCLVPVSSTFPMTHETTVDFWTPTFGGTFR